MKRTVAFLAAVCLSTGILSATVASAQYSPPKSPPPPPPSEAPRDTTGSQSPVAPAAEIKATTTTAQPTAAPDSTGNAAKARRMRLEPSHPRTFLFSLGLGSADNYKPEAFSKNFNPSFGAMLAFGVKQYGFLAGVNFNYNFFLAQGSDSQSAIPNDLNIFTIMGELRWDPMHSTAHPYILACGGYFRQWVVNLDYTENVLGYGGGVGLEMEIDRVKRLFLDARYIEGQTRKTEEQSNTIFIPVRLGVSWEFR
jgi:hypothetical protein